MLCETGSIKDIEKYNNNWVGEKKFDGVRCIAIINNGNVTLKGRSGNVLNNNFKEIVEDLEKIKENVVLDGEMCCETFSITQSRNKTENKLKSKLLREKYPANYNVFDYINNTALDLRKFKLSEIFRKYDFEFVKKVKVTKDLKKLWETAKAENWEGIIIKDLNSKYLNKRSSKWKKIKNIKSEDIFVNSYAINPAGIRCETQKGIAVQVSGSNAKSVKKEIDDKGYSLIEINFLNKTETGKYRMATFKSLKGGN